SRLTVGLARKPLLVRLRSILNPTKVRYPLTHLDRIKMISGACCVALVTVIIGFREQLIPPPEKDRSAFGAASAFMLNQLSEQDARVSSPWADVSEAPWESVSRSATSSLTGKLNPSGSGVPNVQDTGREEWERFLADTGGLRQPLVVNERTGERLLSATVMIPGELNRRQPAIDVPGVSDPQPLAPEDSEPEESVEGEEGPGPGLDQIGDILPYLENILWGPDPGSDSSGGSGENAFEVAGLGISGAAFQVSASLISAPQPIEVIRANAARSATTAKLTPVSPVETAPRQASDIQRIPVDSEKPETGATSEAEQVKASIRVEPGTVLVKGKRHLAVTFWRTIDRKTSLQVQASNDLLEWHSNPQLFYLAKVGGKDERQEVTIGLRAPMAESQFKYMRIREQFAVDVPATPPVE
ncbi:MAG: hypothetical protein AAF514_13045, partial [Verrucomicrobiota bacterium]